MIDLKDTAKVLIDSKIVTEQQWEEAVVACGEDLPKIVELFRNIPAWWSAGLQPHPTLTEYQAHHIIRKSSKEDYRGLKRNLRVKDYLILDKIGEGGMGIVYKGWDLIDNRFVALKRLKTDAIEPRKRLRREARIMQRLDHKAIVRCLKLEKLPKADLLVLEYVAGRDLMQEVKARGRIPWKEVVRWAISVLQGLEYAHKRKIIHRDIKPSNIILQPTTTGIIPKLLDMGLAKCMEEMLDEGTFTGGQTRAGQTLGTYQYMPPEQWQSSTNVSAQSDIYTLGGTLFYAVTGKIPFREDNAAAFCTAHLTKPPPSARALVPEVPPPLDDILRQMLAKKPEHRGTHSELIQLFRNLLKTGPGPSQRSIPTAVATSTWNGGSLGEKQNRDAFVAIPTSQPTPLLQKIDFVGVTPKSRPKDPAIFENVVPLWIATWQVMYAFILWLFSKKEPPVANKKIFTQSPTEDLRRTWARFRRSNSVWGTALKRPFSYLGRWLLLLMVLALITKLFRVW
jgi:eukaryotic-like serine/threonine-protein kinase